ncbi:carboxypeptidase regulatory-like domain-containing protein [Halobacterium salinarum]|uniref:carboxypeptidase regulatory-like domain-containing protein n=1 Tax=Halobacterium salinarum TaxID=2242 RepID=UPI001F22FF39|nr:carboxypeptidase regulatory-like domain-containing protein [Halobacterium salinarum]MCF2165441.1 carboxypeptidase regulatory-like domain-containing protein [Halobacterium salinarum]MCF2168306.1 carboxypeptidase regulatory-like domain-containing protein [Halobacterium salinarum]
MSPSDGNAHSRQELTCPNCHTDGLERFDAFADRHENPRDGIIHGTRCPNCDQRVPPDKVEPQLAPPKWSLAGYSITIPSIIHNPPVRKAGYAFGVLIFVLGFIVVPSMIGPIFGGGNAQQTAPQGGQAIYSDSGWTIYETSDGTYYIHDGNQYLTPNGPSSSPYYYQSEDVARDVLSSYLEYVTSSPEQSSTGFEFPSNTSNTSYSWANNSTAPTNQTQSTGWTYNSTNGNNEQSNSGTPDWGDGGDYNNGGSPDWGDGGDYNNGGSPDWGDGGNNNGGSPDWGDGGDYQPPEVGDGQDQPTTDPPEPDDGWTTPKDKQPLHGAVRDAQGRPVENATITVPTANRSTTTNANGTYAFDTHLPPGDHTVHATSNKLSTRPVAFATQYNGDILVDGDPDYAVYVQDTDGTVAQNQISLIMPANGAGNPIRLFGTGSDISGTVRFQSTANADTARLNLTGVRSSDPQTVAVTPGSPRSLRVTGNTAPDATINLSSTPVSKSVTKQGSTSSTAAVNLSGNLPTTPTVSLSPVNKSTQQVASAQLSGTDSQTRVSVDNRGNVGTPVNVTVNGAAWEESRRQSGQTNSTVSVDVGGVREPDGQQTSRPILNVTGDGRGVAQSYSGGGNIEFTFDQGFPDLPDVKEAFTAPEAGLYRVNWYVHQQVEAQNDDGPKFSSSAESAILVGELPKYVHRDEMYKYELDNDATVYVGASTRWDDKFDINTNSKNKSGSTVVRLEKGEKIHVAGVVGDDAMFTYKTNSHVKSVEKLASAGNVTVSMGEFKRTTTSLQDGESAGIPLPLTTGSNTIDVSTAGPVGVNYTLTWTEHHQTSGAAIQKNGQTVARTDDTFSGTRTLTVPASAVQPGTNELVLTGPRQSDRYDAGLEWTSKTVAKQPEVTTSNGRVLYSGSGIVNGSESVTVDEKIPPTETIRVTAKDGEVEYEVSYPARVVADAPAVSVNDRTYAYPSVVNASGSRLMDSVSVNSSALTLGMNEVEVSARPVDGIMPEVTAAIEYENDLVVTREPTVTVTNGRGESHTAEVPSSQLRNGRLAGGAVLDLPGDWFTRGENTVRVRTVDGSVVEAELTARGIHPQEREFR